MWRVALVAVALLSLVVSGAWAQQELAGKVQKVDAADRTLVLEDGTQVWLAEGISLDELKEGVMVKAMYEERDGKKVATRIEVSP